MKFTLWLCYFQSRDLVGDKAICSYILQSSAFKTSMISFSNIPQDMPAVGLGIIVASGLYPIVYLTMVMVSRNIQCCQCIYRTYLICILRQCTALNNALNITWLNSLSVVDTLHCHYSLMLWKLLETKCHML